MPRGKTEINPKTSGRIKDEMKKAGVSRKDVYDETGISESLLGQIINNKKPLVRENADLLGKYLGVRAEYLLGRDDFRLEEEYLNHIQKMTSMGLYIPTISKKTAFEIFCSHIGITEDWVRSDEDALCKVVIGSQDFYVSKDQMGQVLSLMESNIKSQLLGMYSLLKPGNESLKRKYEKAASEIVYDDRPDEELLAEVKDIPKDPKRFNLDF